MESYAAQIMLKNIQILSAHIRCRKRSVHDYEQVYIIGRGLASYEAPAEQEDLFHASDGEESIEEILQLPEQKLTAGRARSEPGFYFLNRCN